MSNDEQRQCICNDAADSRWNTYFNQREPEGPIEDIKKKEERLCANQVKTLFEEFA